MAASREAATAAAETDDDLPAAGTGSFLVALLVYLWAWGLMSPQTIQKICMAVVKDLNRMNGPDGESIKTEIEKLANLGTGGLYQGNMNAELNTYLGDPVITPTYVQMPMKMMGEAAGALGASVQQAMLLPHVLFSLLGNNYPIAFAKLMCPSKARLAEFWSNVANSPQLKGSRVCNLCQFCMHV